MMSWRHLSASLSLAVLLSECVTAGDAIMPGLRPRGLLTMRSLRVTDSDGEGARVYMGANSEYSMGTDAMGNFVIAQGGHSGTPPIFMIEQSGRLLLRANTTKVQGLDVAVTGGITVNGVSQWRSVINEDFDSPQGAVGWTRNAVTKCAGVTLLGGFCRFAKGEVKKTFLNLPPHDHLRIKATYHFIDRWIGEAGFMKLNIGENLQPVVVWSEQHAQDMSTNGISICGQGTPEGKFAVPIDITIPHTQASIDVTFGSTMDDMDPCDESWGVSSVELLVRR